MERNRLLPLAHLWVAFLSFLPAIGLGFWQMLMRSPLPVPLDNPNAYYASVTAHGSIMAYVFPTFFAMGFGYAIASAAMGGAHFAPRIGGGPHFGAMHMGGAPRFAAHVAPRRFAAR